MLFAPTGLSQDPLHGTELWKKEGTGCGTKLMNEICSVTPTVPVLYLYKQKILAI